MSDEKKTPGKVIPMPQAQLNVPLQVTAEQFKALQKTIIVGAAINGLLAAGRIPNTPENKRYLDAAVAAGLERL